MKADWEKILKKKIVRKTVAIHPIVDYYIRLTMSILTQLLASEGIDVDVSYSVALNWMLLWIILAVGSRGKTHDPDVLDALFDFLYDRKTIEKLNLEEMQAKFRERVIEEAARMLKKVSRARE